MALRAVEAAPPTPIDGREQIVATLRRLLSEAEAGHITELAYVAMRPTRTVSTGWADGRGYHDNFAMLGGIHQLAWRLNAAIDAGENVPLPDLPEPS